MRNQTDEKQLYLVSDDKLANDDQIWNEADVYEQYRDHEVGTGEVDEYNNEIMRPSTHEEKLDNFLDCNVIPLSLDGDYYVGYQHGIDYKIPVDAVKNHPAKINRYVITSD